MSEHDLSDVGDVLAARFADIGINPESNEPINLPSAEPTKSTDADLIAQVVAEDDASPSAPAPVTQPATAPVAAPATAPAEPSSTAGPPSVMAYLKDRYGEDFTGKYQSDEAFLQGVLNLNKRIGQRDEEAQLGRVLKDQPEVAVRFLMQQRPDLFPQPQQAPAPQPQSQQPPADTSQFSPEWIAALQLKEGVDPRVKQDIAKWLTNQQLVASPIGQELAQTKAQVAELRQMLAQGVPQQHVDGQIAQLRQEREQERQTQLAEQFVGKNYDKFFTNVNGVRIRTPENYVFAETFEKSMKRGDSFEAAFELANAKLDAMTSKKTVAAPAAPVTANAAAARQPAPAIPQAEASYDWFRDGEDLGAALERNLKHFGHYDALQTNF